MSVALPPSIDDLPSSLSAVDPTGPVASLMPLVFGAVGSVVSPGAAGPPAAPSEGATGTVAPGRGVVALGCCWRCFSLNVCGIGDVVGVDEPPPLCSSGTTGTPSAPAASMMPAP